MGCCRMDPPRENVDRIKVKERKKKRAMIFHAGFHGCADVDTARRGCIYLLLLLLTFYFNTEVIHQVASSFTPDRWMLPRLGHLFFSLDSFFPPVYTILLRFFFFFSSLPPPLAATAADLLQWWVSHLIRAVVMIVTVTCFSRYGPSWERLATKRNNTGNKRKGLDT